jgi:hypothetical protein
MSQNIEVVKNVHFSPQYATLLAPLLFTSHRVLI